MSTGRVLFSAAEESFGAAVRELRSVFGRQLAVERIGPDAGVLSEAAPGVPDVAAACRDRVVFVRHLTVELTRVPRDGADLDAVSRAALSVVDDAGAGPALAVQAWASGAPRMGYSSGELFQRLAGDLEDRLFTVSHAGAVQVLSCCVTESGVSIGVNDAAHSLADWPGGRVRLAREADRVSRAESKLEELFEVFPLELPAGGRAVDLGASPGGWTRILRRHGLAVWAVDPGDLDPRVAADPRVHHARTTAGEFLRTNTGRFDVAVNDMRMTPELSSRVMVDAARHLRRGALAVVTLKTGTHQPVETVRRCLATLRSSYRVLFARQLHHNRHEVTVVARVDPGGVPSYRG